MKQYQMFIDGTFVNANDGRWFETQNPYTGKAWAEVARGTEADVDRAVRAADQAFRTGPWPEMTATQRGALLRKLGDLIARDAERLAEFEVQDNGKLLAEMSAQLRYLPQWFYYFGGLADKIEGAVIPLDKRGYFNFTRREPLGVVAAITPWNSPLMLLAWKIAPALAAGCTVVVKPSEFTSASAIAVRGSRFSRRCLQRRDRVWRGGGLTAGDASAGQEGDLYRFRCHRARHQPAVRGAVQAREPGAWRQVAEHHLQRCQPG
jgi:aldehyde dehydrogenase (NAD+)